MMPETIANASFLVLGSNYLILKQGWNLISLPYIQTDTDLLDVLAPIDGKQGWNLISLPYIQTDTDLLDVLAPIDGLYDAVQWYDVTDSVKPWKHYNKDKLMGNDLVKLNETMGFWIHIIPSGDTLFMYNGNEPIVNLSISISPGWNQVGFPSIASYNRTKGLNNINFGSDVDVIQWFNATTQTWNIMGSSDNFVKGRGYWLHSKVTKVWDVPL
jgi:hypothetical protein